MKTTAKSGQKIIILFAIPKGGAEHSLSIDFILYTPDVKVPCLWGLVTDLFIVSRRKSLQDVKEKWHAYSAVCVVANCILKS
jgi:hypothetical protein